MRWIWATWALVACSGGVEETPAAEDVDFASDLRPLLADNCARCHGESHLAPNDFLDFQTVSQWAEIMVSKIESGEMPPPLADPDCHPYQGDELAGVDPALRDTLVAWIDAGKPEGDLANAPEITIGVPPTLSRQDLVLEAAAPMAPKFVDGNEYRCFLLDDSVDADTYVTGIEFLIDHPQISHHALLFIDPDGGSERLVEDAASKSWTCPGVIPESEWEPIHAWAPSGGAVEFQDGLGMKLAKGDQLILQMHYYSGTTEVLEDRAGYALKLDDTVRKELFYAPLGPNGFVIPAGNPAYTATYEIETSFAYGLTLDVYGVMPHMHLLGSGYDFHSVNGAGEESCISRSDDYDFSTQPTYWFDTPVTLDPTSTVSVSCTWDNSAENPNQQNDPPQDVFWGENTQEEMCFALMYVGIH